MTADARDAAEHADTAQAVVVLDAFVTEIYTAFDHSRRDLRKRWDSADNLPLYPTDASLPTTTLGVVRQVLNRLKQLEEELNEQREYVAALNEAQVGLQTSAFRRGWWTCRTAMQQAVDFTQSELATLEYAKQVREVTVAEPAAGSGQDSAAASPKPVVCGSYSSPGLGGILGPCTKPPGQCNSNEWHLDASGAAWEPNKEGTKAS